MITISSAIWLIESSQLVHALGNTSSVWAQYRVWYASSRINHNIKRKYCTYIIQKYNVLMHAIH